MKKLSASLATVIAAVAVASSPVAASTANTGTRGPAEEPTWFLPFLLAAVAIALVCGVLAAKGTRSR